MQSHKSYTSQQMWHDHECKYAYVTANSKISPAQRVCKAHCDQHNDRMTDRLVA